MRRTLILLTSFVVLFACGGREPKINAPDLEGLGRLSLGMTTEEAEDALKENSSEFGRAYDMKDKSKYFYMKAKPEDVQDYKETEASYYVSEEIRLQLTLGFFKDTLVIVRVPGGYEGAGTVRDAFKAKYGDGAMIGKESSYNFLETWRSESVTAVYFLQDDRNSNLYERRRAEHFELRPTVRDIRRELVLYDEAIATEKESQRQETLKGL